VIQARRSNRTPANASRSEALMGHFVGGTVVYVKVVLRADCVVVSFREEEDQSDEDE
jgi:hypothetical protein